VIAIENQSGKTVNRYSGQNRIVFFGYSVSLTPLLKTDLRAKIKKNCPPKIKSEKVNLPMIEKR